MSFLSSGAVTRPSLAENEVHDQLSYEEFEIRCKNGDAAFHWEAHGHGYIIPKHVETSVQRGKICVFNASRSVVRQGA